MTGARGRTESQQAGGREQNERMASLKLGEVVARDDNRSGELRGDLKNDGVRCFTYPDVFHSMLFGKCPVDRSPGIVAVEERESEQLLAGAILDAPEDVFEHRATHSRTG